MSLTTRWKFPLRARVREVTTGQEGEVTGRCEYADGSRRYAVTHGEDAMLREESMLEAIDLSG